jgi:hypothetical protein
LIFLDRKHIRTFIEPDPSELEDTETDKEIESGVICMGPSTTLSSSKGDWRVSGSRKAARIGKIVHILIHFSI